jgi:flagellar hook assembly protein FlgD
LLQNFPNPFNPETWIPYQIKEASEVKIRIYSAAGELVRELDLGSKLAGVYVTHDRAAYWDGRNASGEEVASGIYFYSIRAGDFAAVRKLTVLK